VPTPPTPAQWQALADRFALGQVSGSPTYVTRGFMGEIWQLHTARGRWAVKWQFPWAPADPRPADIGVQLAAADAGIPLPLPVTGTDGTAVARIGGQHARVYEWADLGAPFSPPVSAGTAAEVGRLLGVLHRLSMTVVEPVDPWYTAVPDAGHWAKLVRRASAAGASWADRLSAALGLIADLSAQVAPPAGRPPIVCHRDFNPDNVFPSPAGGLIVLDWENSGPLHPDGELGYAIFTWCAGSGRFDREAAEALRTGYAKSCGAAPPLRPWLFGTAIATHVNVLSVMIERALTEPDHREHAEAQIASLLDHDLADLRRVMTVVADHGPQGGAAVHPGTLAPTKNGVNPR